MTEPGTDRRGAACSRRLGVWSFGLLLLFAAAPARPQIAPEGSLKLQSEFNFSNPGARSLGIAGAFLARADDTTAAFVNPAGLIHLQFPEVTLEGRHWNTDVEIHDANGDSTMLDSSQSGASFAGASLPLKRFTLALYWHQLARFDVSGQGGGFGSADLDLSITGVGLAAGFRILPWFRAGVAVVGYQSDLSGHSTGPGGETTSANGDGTEFGFTLGYQADLSDAWSLGFVFRQAPSFDVKIETANETRIEKYTVPNLIGLGVAWQATYRLLASLDYDVIHYSSTVSLDELDGGVFVVPDAHEVRLGFEYTIWEYATSPAFRIGVWHDPDHRVRWKPTGSQAAEEPRLEFPRGDDEIHFSLGAGVLLGRLQLDVAADLADTVDTYSVSFVYFP